MISVSSASSVPGNCVGWLIWTQSPIYHAEMGILHFQAVLWRDVGIPGVLTRKRVLEPLPHCLIYGPGHIVRCFWRYWSDYIRRVRLMDESPRCRSGIVCRGRRGYLEYDSVCGILSRYSYDHQPASALRNAVLLKPVKVWSKHIPITCPLQFLENSVKYPALIPMK